MQSHGFTSEVAQPVDGTNSRSSQLNFFLPSWVRLQILIHPPPLSPWRPKKEKKRRQRQLNIYHDQSETYVSLQYPFSDAQQPPRPPPHLHPISHCVPSYRAQPQKGSARGEHRCQEQLTPKSLQHFTFSFHYSSQGDFIKVSSDKLSPPRPPRPSSSSL